jgi:hypothetical protein
VPKMWICQSSAMELVPRFPPPPHLDWGSIAANLYGSNFQQVVPNW